ncbi:hypothetical protein ACHQM5_004816 [Ranunculus cassubicifolius]
MGRLDWVLRRRIESSRISPHKIDEIVDHLQSNFPAYRRIRNFSKRVEETLYAMKPQQKHNLPLSDSDSDDINGNGSINAVIPTPSSSSRRKHKKSDALEVRLGQIEAGHVSKRRKQNSQLKNDTSSSSSLSSSSGDGIYDEKVEPEFDLMKSMLRDTYSLKSKSKVLEEKNIEMEVDNTKAKKVEMMLGNGGGDSVRRERKKGELAKSYKEEVKGRDGVEGKGKDGPMFKDLGGIKDVLEELMMEVIVPLYHPQLPRHLGVKPISGILLHGPPGCGKTKLAHAIANETGVPFYKISATEIVTGVSGASEENIRNLFSKAYRTAPSIVFIDEIDAIASKRESLQKEMERRIVTQLMTCMDESHQSIAPADADADADADAEPDSGTSDRKPGYVLVIGATNRPDAVDSALRRPGRFDREIVLGVPDEKARVEILSVITSKLRLEGAFDLDIIARITPGFVGADLAALANKAGNIAMKRIIDGRKSELSVESEVVENIEEWWKRPWLHEEMENLSITMADFEEAAKIVQPSSRREGFSDIPNVKWEDVGGLDLLRKEFDRYIVSRIKRRDDYAGPEILNKYVGESELTIRTIFRRARTCAPCILFFDEVDALTTRRGSDGSWVIERLLNQLLIELDGAGQRHGVYVIGATNRPEVMDRAVLRPGRFGKLLYVPLPGPDERGLILKALSRKKPIDNEVDFNAIGKKEACENLSGADLAAVMNEAAMAAMDEKQSLDVASDDERSWTIKTAHFDKALTKVFPSVSDKQKSYYENMSKSFRAA